MFSRAFVFVLAALVLGGCAGDPFRSPATAAYRSPVELEDTPFFPQEDYQCGPAALATVLARSGVDVRPDELVPRVYLPGRHGSLQSELLAASRSYGRLPYVLAPELPALLAEVQAGRPVLVLQNLGVSAIPVWHYAVVVGFSPDDGEIVLRSGTDRRRVTDAGLFVKTWRRGSYWGVVLLRPGELPARPDQNRFLKAAAAAESAGFLPLAEASYRAAVARWPDSHLTALGLGNVAYAGGDLARAERWYRRALELEPRDAATLNNLAVVVAEQGRCGEGSRLVDRAMALTDVDAATAARIAETRAEIAACVEP
ncbi:MAG TPA: PA2778 family cysteine peptidase [Woeseiaceae bacterium]|nr:PA2778 family cysteine peptidase [Woeseiaceae bacterium]